MLRSLHAMFDYHLAAQDGVMGTVQDFLFDDESWVIHYLVAETPSPLGKRSVLILPFAVGRPDWELKRLPVRLTGEQIRTSPPLEADMPLSRQYQSGVKLPGSHLRSVREVLGYKIHATDGEVGTIQDFIVEDILWGVHYAVLGLKNPAGRSILLAPDTIRSISLPGKAAWVNLSAREIAECPDFDSAAPVNRGEEHRLYDFYGRPAYQTTPAILEDKPDARHP